MIVDALVDEVDAISDWQPLLEVLLMDHTSVAVEMSGRKSKKKGKAAKEPSSSSEDSVDDAWRLDEVEEGIMLEVLVASLSKITGNIGSTAGPGKKVSRLNAQHSKRMTSIFKGKQGQGSERCDSI
jgi:cohesin complex subunit SA-1/2